MTITLDLPEFLLIMILGIACVAGLFSIVGALNRIEEALYDDDDGDDDSRWALPPLDKTKASQ